MKKAEKNEHSLSSKPLNINIYSGLGQDVRLNNLNKSFLKEKHAGSPP